MEVSECGELLSFTFFLSKPCPTAVVVVVVVGSTRDETSLECIFVRVKCRVAGASGENPTVKVAAPPLAVAVLTRNSVAVGRSSRGRTLVTDVHFYVCWRSAGARGGSDEVPMLLGPHAFGAVKTRHPPAFARTEIGEQLG